MDISIRRWFDKLILIDDALLLDWVVRVAAIAFLLDDIVEYQIYIRGLRIFLPSPIIPIVNTLPVWTDWLVSSLHTVSLVFLIWRPRLRPFLMIVLAMTAWRVLGDLQRFKPWIMMYSFTLVAMSLPMLREQARLQALRLMIIGLYFWAGFNKLNSAFYMKIFPWFINPFWTYSETHHSLNLLVMSISFTVPIFELSIGIFLLFKKLQKPATLMALIMLIVVLACLGPFGHNSAFAVWPWNIYLFITEMILFLAPHPPCLQDIRENYLAQAAIALFIAAPTLGLWGWWHADPSFKLYAGNEDQAILILDAREKRETWPDEILSTLLIPYHEKDAPSGCSTAPETNTFWLSVPYPNEYVYKAGGRGLCPYLIHPETAIIRILHPGQFDSLHVTQKDAPLCSGNRPSLWGN